MISANQIHRRYQTHISSARICNKEMVALRGFSYSASYVHYDWRLASHPQMCTTLQSMLAARISRGAHSLMHIGYNQSKKRKTAYGSVSDSLDQSARIFISLHIEQRMSSNQYLEKGKQYGTIACRDEAIDKITMTTKK